MNMKTLRILLLTLCVACCFVFVACGDVDTYSDESSVKENSQQSTDVTKSSVSDESVTDSGKDDESGTTDGSTYQSSAT